MTVETSNTEHRYKPGAAMLAEALPAMSFETADDLIVELLPLGAVDFPVTLARDADYAIGGDGVNAAGTITALRPFHADDVVFIRRASRLLQQANLKPDERLPVEDLERTLDGQTRAMQEVARDASYGVRLPYGESGYTLPSAANRPLRIFGFDVLGGPFLHSDVSLFSLLEAALLAGLPKLFKGNPGSAGKAYASIAALALAGDLATAGDDAALSVPGREGSFYFDDGDISAEVAANPSGGIFVARAGDPTGLTGGWVRLHHGVIRPEWIGSLDDRTSARIAVQEAMDMVSVRGPVVGAIVVIPNRFVETDRVLYQESECVLAPAGPLSELFNTKIDNATAIENVTLTQGVYHPNHLCSNTNGGKVVVAASQPIADVIDGAMQIEITNSADAANFKKGDVLTVRTDAHYSTPSGGEHPHLAPPNVVAGPGDPVTGLVPLVYPVQGDIVGGGVVNWTKEQAVGANISPGRFFGPVRDVKILGGLKIGSDNPNQWAVGGLSASIGSELDYEVTGKSNGVAASNGSAFTTYRVKGVGLERAAEIKNHTVACQFDIIARRLPGGTQNKNLFELGEGAMRNTVRLWLEDGRLLPGTVLRLNSVGDNTVDLMRLSAKYTSGSLCTISLLGRTTAFDVTDTQEEMEPNRVRILCDIDTGALSRHVWMLDSSADQVMKPQRVTGGARIFTQSTVAAMRFDNTRGGEVYDITFNDGEDVEVVNDAAGMSLNVSGAINVPLLGNFRRAVIDGVAQFTGGVQIEATGNHPLDMAARMQTITITADPFNFQGLENGSANTVVQVVLQNGSGGAVTPTSAAIYILPAGYAWPSIPDGASIAFKAQQTSGAKIALSGFTAP